MRPGRLGFVSHALLLGLALGQSRFAFAVDGVIEINEARAAAGGVTPADQPGYPVTIGENGSYRLTSNLTVGGDPADTSAIVVTASSNVSIDLNGFTIGGPTFCTGIPAASCAPGGTAFGINAQGRQAVTVRNGFIRGFPDRGIIAGPRALIEDVVVSSNGENGIQVDSNSIVRHCRASQNGNDGISGSSSVIFEHDSADSNGAVGLRTSTNAVVSESTASGNKTSGIVVFGGTAVRGNTASGNVASGISAGGAIVVIGNTAIGNGQVGLALGANAGYLQNVLSGNNGGDANAQVTGGIDLGANICGATGSGNGITCP